jgi:hypothetical protein
MNKKGDEVPILVAGTGPLNGQRWALRSTMTAGRDPTCEIVIANRQVSREHVRFSPSLNGVIIEDLGSKNGTHHNGLPLVESRLLQDGDVIQVALAQKFTFLSSDATLPLESEGLGESGHEQPGRLRLEKRSRRVWIGDQEVDPPLSVSQFKLLELLYEHEGRVVSREDLISTVWGKEQAITVSEQALDALIRRLRDRLATIDPTHPYVATVRGHGLRLDNPPID